MLEQRAVVRTVLSIALIGSMACTIRPSEPARPTSTPITQPKPPEKGRAATAPLPERKPPEKPVATATPVPDRLRDFLNSRKINESVTLDKPRIGSVNRFPWLGDNAYVSTLNSVVDGQTSLVAILFRSNCLYNGLRENNLLGGVSFPGHWPVNREIDRLSGEIAQEHTALTPDPFIKLNWVVINRKKYPECKEDEEDLKQLIDAAKGFNWRGLPGNFAEFVGRLAGRAKKGFDKERQR